MSESEEDKKRAFVKQIISMVLTAVVSIVTAYFAATMSAQKEIDHVEGRLDAQTDRQQWGKSQEYINGLVEETLVKDASDALKEEAQDGEDPNSRP